MADGQDGAVIINIIIVTSHGLYGIAHSQAARAGVETFSKHLAVEWAQYGIRVNCVAPGAIQNQGWRVYTDDARATYPRTNPQMRAGSSWDIAQACAWLASPAAGYITGENHIVDGGGQHWGEVWTAGKPDWFRDPA
jgi:citronellol/citronellal dehydrogenase